MAQIPKYYTCGMFHASVWVEANTYEDGGEVSGSYTGTPRVVLECGSTGWNKRFMLTYARDLRDWLSRVWQAFNDDDEEHTELAALRAENARLQTALDASGVVWNILSPAFAKVFAAYSEELKNPNGSTEVCRVMRAWPSGNAFDAMDAALTPTEQPNEH